MAPCVVDSFPPARQLHGRPEVRAGHEDQHAEEGIDIIIGWVSDLAGSGDRAGRCR